MEHFRLNALRIKDHEVFSDIQIDLSSPKDGFLDASPYFTLVIGQNGTGKSNLLKFIIDIFRVAYEKRNGIEVSHYPKGKYTLEYTYGSTNYTITNRFGLSKIQAAVEGLPEKEQEKGLRFFSDGASEIAYSELPLPDSLLALSIMLTDKFPVLRKSEDFPIYRYLGVRRDSNTAGTRSYISRTIDAVFAAAARKSFINDVQDLLSFLDLKPELYIGYTPRYKHIFFSGDLTVDLFTNFFLNNKDYLDRKTEPWSVGIFKTLQEEEPDIIPQLVDLLNYLATILETYEGTRSKYFEFDVFGLEPKMRISFRLLPYLHRLDLISYPYLVIGKKENYYDLEESSSGEYHFISTILGLVASITPNSVILIDEPEISLHPNWQMKYLGFLHKLFKKYETTHFIICTHSHFLVSDLPANNSTIIALEKDQIIKQRTIDRDTYGWSAEEVLYEVFKVRTTRNYYLEFDLTRLVSMVSNNSDDFVAIQGLIDKLLTYSFSINDPINLLIRKGQDYLNKRQNASTQ